MNNIVTFSSSVNPADDLDTLATKIRDALQVAQSGMRTAVRFTLDAGDALNAAKKQVPEGGWGRWLKDHCFLSQRTAQVYMRLANHRDEIETKLMEIPDLSVRVARKFIAKPASQESNEDPVPATPKTKISQRELDAAQMHIAELETARERDRDLVAEMKDAKALKAKNDALRATLENISTLLSEARALSVHLPQNRNAVLGKMQSAKTAADVALGKVKPRSPKNTVVRCGKKKKQKRPLTIEGTATHLN
jgi:hypothetical protein